MMGGDPIWNNDGAYFGTITFAAQMGSPIMIEGYSCANECVSCNHALYVAGQTAISTSKYPDSMSLTWNIVPPSGMFWIDVAGATINSGIPFTALEVRGLGGIKATKQPTTGIRVSKFGAATGLTSGRDGGIALKEVDHVSHPYEKFTVRVVQGPFSAKGDFLTFMNNTTDPAQQVQNALFLRREVAGENRWLPNPMKIDHVSPALPSGKNDPDFAAARNAYLAELDAFGARLQADFAAGKPLRSFPPVRAAQQETIPGSDTFIGNRLGADEPGPSLGKLNQHLMKNVLGPMEKNVEDDRQALQAFLHKCK